MWTNFPRFGSLKFRFLPIRETNVSRYLAKSVKIFFLLRPENAILPSREIHVSRLPSFVWANFAHVWENFLCEQILRMREKIFCILAVWKFDCCRFVKPTFQGTSQRVGIYFIFKDWKCDFAQSCNPRFTGTKYRVSNFSASTKLRVNKLSAFCLPKMRFLPIRETNLSRYLAVGIY